MKQVTDIPLPPPRPADSHKGTFGTVIVIGGCGTMLGAPALTARAALRAGVGLVKVACPPSVLPHVLTIEPSATGIALADDAQQALEQIEHADPDAKAVLAVGPGLGQDTQRMALVVKMLHGQRTVVLDADGLSLLASALKRNEVETTACPLVVTPHPGEYRRLAEALGIDAEPVGGEAERGGAASLLAGKLDALVVLKGRRTVIADTQQFAINHTGNPALATAGTGDVLTGVIASLIAQGMARFDAAQLGVYAHGLAADRWADQHTRRGLRAIELADAIPQAFAQSS